MNICKVRSNDLLPLTCSRSGTCCYGKLVLLNPWELLCLAEAKGITAKEFRDLYCDFGGIRLKFNGKLGWKDQEACSQYVDKFGCSVHSGRPLACRLYPIGRQIQNNKVDYMYQGDKFPCLEACPEVVDLPLLTVDEYLKGQLTEKFEKAQDAYLEIVQKIADIAFELLLDTGLAESGDKETLRSWRKAGKELPEEILASIGQEWIDCLMIPDIIPEFEDSVVFAEKHYEIIKLMAQTKFGSIQSFIEIQEASALIIRAALLLARSVGADSDYLAEHWIEIAKLNGAQE